MLDTYGSYFFNESTSSVPIVKPNIRTGEGRMKCRPLSRHKIGDRKKKVLRKIAKKSRRISRR